MSRAVIEIVGAGVFGRFLRELLEPHATIVGGAPTAILAVPADAYLACAGTWRDRHLVNVCSVQEQTSAACRAVTTNFTSLHPLFGPRTPAHLRSSIVTHECFSREEDAFLIAWSHATGRAARLLPRMLPDDHDRLMARTHGAALLATERVADLVVAGADVPDEQVPNSFRLLRQFVAAFEDMPAGTRRSILANPYLKREG